jgi:uracil-DNA glycosylase
MPSDLWQAIPAAWQSGLVACRSDIEEIDRLLSKSKENGIKVVPSREYIFSALAVLPQKISVVLIGQDPYPSPSQAIGLAFAVSPTTNPMPASLRNIFREVRDDVGAESTADRTLSSWVDQGVLLLNTSLTTVAGVRAAHTGWPWESVVRSLIEQVAAVNPKVVGLLWGNHAKRFTELFDPESVVASAHPSPLSANRGFFGSKPFSRANQILMANEKDPIRW